jgi:uncharacterized protein (TIGR02246 family)
MSYSTRTVLVSLLTLPWLLGALVPASPTSDEEEIRDWRARSNAAIARHDAAGVAETFMEDVTVVTSIGSRDTGKADNQAAFERIFRDRPDVRYVRQPEEVAVFPAWAVASERGRWTGRWTDADGEVRISGTYLAQWRKLFGRWLIQAELFVPVVCESKGGSYCREHP